MYVCFSLGGLQYLTVRGSGHMVPEYKPEISLAFVEAFVKGQDFQRYVKPPNNRRELFPGLDLDDAQ